MRQGRAKGQGHRLDGGGGGGKRLGMATQLCSSRACLHTAFIAFSVPVAFGWPVHVLLAHCAAPYTPWLGQETRSSWFSPGYAGEMGK